jgi:putative ABC transport system permease protein
MARGVWAAAFLLRRLRADAGVALLVFVLVGLTAGLFAVAPRLLARTSDAALEHELAGARVTERNIQVSVISPPGGPGQPLDAALQAGVRFEGSMPDSLRALIGDTAFAVQSTRFAVEQAPSRRYESTFVQFEYQDDLDGQIELVDGRMPTSLGSALSQPLYGIIPDDYQPPEELPRFEIALSDEASQAAGLHLGDILTVAADVNDFRLPRAFSVAPRAEVEIVGIFHVLQPDAEAWYADPSLQVLNLVGPVDNPLAFVTGLVARDAYNDLAASGLPFIHSWRYYVYADAVDSANVASLIDDIQRFETRFVTSATVSTTRAQPVLRTGLPDLLSHYLAERSTSEAVLSVAAIGPLVLAGAAVGMVGILIVNRRRAAIALTRSRGASSVVLLGAQLWEAILVVGSAVLAGSAMAALLVPAQGSFASLVLALGVGVGAVAALVLATWPATRRPLRELHGDESRAERPAARRLVLEATAVVLALGGIFLLQQRGLTVKSGELTTFDPLLAATPALAGLAVGIVAMRLYPLPIRFLGWLAAGRRDLVPVLGLRTVGRHPSVANLPLLVLMLTAAFGAFASVVVTTVDRGQQVASWEDIGADYRIERIGGGPVDRLQPQAVSGVEAVAPAYIDRQARFSSTKNQRASILFYALDLDAYADVVAGAPVDGGFPSALRPQTAPLGTEASPIPAVLSRRLPPASEPVGPGDTFSVMVAGQQMTFVDVQQRLDFVALPAATAFVIAPLDLVEQAYTNQTLTPNQLLVRAPQSSEAGLRQLVNDDLALGQLTSRYATYDALRDAPLVAAVVLGFGAALVVAAAYTAMTVMAALTLSAAARTRDLAFLRTLGLSSRQALSLTVMEHAPPVLIALIPGVVLGVAVAVLLTPALGLAAFAGTDRALALTVEWGPILLMSAALLLVVSAAIGLSTWLSRRARAADALRMGDD